MKACSFSTSLVFLCLFGVSGTAQSDSLKAFLILQEVQAQYLEHPSYSAESVVKYFLDHHTGEARETEKLLVKKKGEMLYKSYVGLEEMKNPTTYISVYHPRGYITIAPSREHPLKELLGIGFDGYFESAAHIEVSHPDQDHADLLFLLNDPLLEKVLVRVDTKRKLLEKQVIYYAHAYMNTIYNSDSFPRVEIDLVSFDPEPAIPEALFYGDQFLVEANGKQQVRPELRNYTINNRLRPKKEEDL